MNLNFPSQKLCMHFCQFHKLHLDPSLYLDGKQIPVVKEYIFLGIMFDNKLTFIPPIQYLKSKCKNALNVLKVVSHTGSQGGRRSTAVACWASDHWVASSNPLRGKFRH